jgi:hypothetical protein
MWIDEIRVDGQTAAARLNGGRVKKGLGASARGSSTDNLEKGTPGRCRNDIAIAVVPYNRCVFHQ